MERNNQTDEQIQQALVTFGPFTVSVGVKQCPTFMNAGPTTNISCFPNV